MRNKEKQRGYWNDWYDRNRSKKMAWVEIRNKPLLEIRRSMIAEAKSKPCADCGIQYPPHVMDFDHLRDKEFTISAANTIKVGLQRLVAEIAKCDVVCSNCHRQRTWQRKNATVV